MKKPVQITAVHLTAGLGRVQIMLEINGKWLKIADELAGDTNAVSLIIEANGIREILKKSLQ